MLRPFMFMRRIALATAGFAGPPWPPLMRPAAPKKLIFACERLVNNDEIRRDPTRTSIPFFCVDAVCEVPYGSYPGNMPYEYFSDEEHLRRWLGVAKEPHGH